MDCFGPHSFFFFASWSGVFSHYSLRAECSCLKLHWQYAGDLVNWYVALLLRLMCPHLKEEQQSKVCRQAAARLRSSGWKQIASRHLQRCSDSPLRSVCSLMEGHQDLNKSIPFPPNCKQATRLPCLPMLLLGCASSLMGSWPL